MQIIKTELPILSSLSSKDLIQLKLLKGKEITGEIVATLQDKFILHINGKNLLAESNLPLQVGEKLILKVIQSEKEKVILQILKREFLSVASEKELNEIFLSLGISPSSENREIINFLVLRQLPILLEIFNLMKYLKEVPLLGTQMDLLFQQLFSLLKSESEIKNREKIFDFLKNLEEIVLRETNSKQLEEKIVKIIRNLQQSFENKIEVEENFFDIKYETVKSLNFLPNHIIDTLRGIIKNIDAQRIINSGKNENTFFYIQIPIKFGEKNSTLEIKIYPDSFKENKIDKDNLRISLLLNTPNLGWMEFYISIFNKIMTCNVFVEEWKIKKFLENNFQELMEGLKKMPYDISSITCSVKKGLAKLSKNIFEDINSIVIKKLDVKV